VPDFFGPQTPQGSYDQIMAQSRAMYRKSGFAEAPTDTESIFKNFLLEALKKVPMGMAAGPKFQVPTQMRSTDPGITGGKYQRPPDSYMDNFAINSSKDLVDQSYGMGPLTGGRLVNSSSPLPPRPGQGVEVPLNDNPPRIDPNAQFPAIKPSNDVQKYENAQLLQSVKDYLRTSPDTKSEQLLRQQGMANIGKPPISIAHNLEVQIAKMDAELRKIGYSEEQIKNYSLQAKETALKWYSPETE